MKNVFELVKVTEERVERKEKKDVKHFMLTINAAAIDYICTQVHMLNDQNKQYTVNGNIFGINKDEDYIRFSSNLGYMEYYVAEGFVRIFNNRGQHIYTNFLKEHYAKYNAPKGIFKTGDNIDVVNNFLLPMKLFVKALVGKKITMDNINKIQGGAI